MNDHEYLIQALHSAEFAVADLQRGMADASAVEVIVLLSLIEKACLLRNAIDGFLTACDES